MRNDPGSVGSLRILIAALRGCGPLCARLAAERLKGAVQRWEEVVWVERADELVALELCPLEVEPDVEDREGDLLDEEPREQGCESRPRTSYGQAREKADEIRDARRPQKGEKEANN